MDMENVAVKILSTIMLRGQSKISMVATNSMSNIMVANTRLVPRKKAASMMSS
jgi:hypothetical protein